jgi:hypothetical protein
MCLYITLHYIFREEKEITFLVLNTRVPSFIGLVILLTLYNHAAVLTAIADGFSVCRTDFIKISAPYFMDGKTFRTAVVSQLFFSNGKMAVAAAQLIALVR